MIPYNLPAAICMKTSNIILGLLIDGPHEPTNKIDTYLQLVIDEIKRIMGEWSRDL